MNCILGDGGSSANLYGYLIGLMVLCRDGSRQDAAGLHKTTVYVVCVLIILQTLSLFAYIREQPKGPCGRCNWCLWYTHGPFSQVLKTLISSYVLSPSYPLGKMLSPLIYATVGCSRFLFTIGSRPLAALLQRPAVSRYPVRTRPSQDGHPQRRNQEIGRAHV